MIMATNSLQTLRNRSHWILVLLVLVGISIIPGTSRAQQTGQIAGRISDADTKEYLPGANVMLKGSGFGAATDRAGSYRIQNVPAGDYEMIVRYIGYEEQTLKVTVASGGTLVKDVALKTGVVQLSGIEINGLREGQNKALNAQKSSEKIMNVVAAEQILSFPDVNGAEALQRIPGISIQRDQGEGRFVQVRGTEARLSNMVIDGQSIPSPDNTTRQTMMDVIPADQLASIEVSKVITPDMDGNSVGGTVNLITKSALDNSRDILNVTVGSGYSDKKPLGYYQNSLKGTYQFGLNYGTRLGEEKNIGIMFTASFLRNDRGSSNNQITYAPITTVGKVLIPYAFTDLMLRDYALTRDRLGLSGTVDFKPDDKSKYSLTVVYNDFDDNESRDQWRARPSKGKYNSATSVTGATIEVLTRDRGQEDLLNNFVGRGQNHLGNIVIDYSASYNRGSETQHYYVSPTFVINKKVDFALDLSNPDIPKYTVGGTGIPAGYELNAANYTISSSAGFRVQEGIKSTNTSYGGSLNLKMPYSFLGYAADLKFGGKADLRKKDRVGTDSYYLWTGTTPLLMSQFVGTQPTISTLAGDYSGAWGQMPDFQKVRDFFDANKNGLLKPTLNHDNTEAVNNDLTEDIYAGYAMTTINFDQLMVVAGVRDEMTSNKVNANIIEYDKSGNFLKATPATADHSFNVVLPMLNFKYLIDPQTNLRAAVTTGVGRANFVDLVPSRIIHDDANTITMGNPDLQPTTSTGLDLLAEHFFQRVGVLSAGAFYKSLTNIIYPSVYPQVGGTFAGYMVTQPVNGPTASMYGFEFDWQQQLTFMPGFLDGLGLYANYTYTKSTADLPGHSGAKLPGQAGNTANLSLSYQKYGFTAKVSANYADKFLFTVGATSADDIWYDSHMQYDANVSMDIWHGLSVYAQIMNINNAPLRYYMGITEQPTQREYYSWWTQFGIKFNM